MSKNRTPSARYAVAWHNGHIHSHIQSYHTLWIVAWICAGIDHAFLGQTSWIVKL